MKKLYLAIALAVGLTGGMGLMANASQAGGWVWITTAGGSIAIRPDKVTHVQRMPGLGGWEHSVCFEGRCVKVAEAEWVRVLEGR